MTDATPWTEADLTQARELVGEAWVSWQRGEVFDPDRGEQSFVPVIAKALAAVRRERDAERTRYVLANAGWKEMNRQVAQLRAALVNFGVHFAPCRYAGTTLGVGPQEQCSCGLTAALAGVPPPPPDYDPPLVAQGTFDTVATKGELPLPTDDEAGAHG